MQLRRSAQTTVVIPATIEFVDITGLVKGASQGEGLGDLSGSPSAFRSPVEA